MHRYARGRVECFSLAVCIISWINWCIRFRS